MSSYVKRFEGRGHVRRERNPQDGRSYVMRLTPAGFAAHRSATACFLPVLEQVVARLSSRGTAVRQALTTLRRSIESTGAT